MKEVNKEQIKTKEIPTFFITIPEYTINQKPDYHFVGKKIDEVIRKNFLNRGIAIRAISVADHPSQSAESLVDVIKEAGTDKYDPDRKMVQHDFYRHKTFHLFALPCVVSEDTEIMHEFVGDFYEGALEDRGYSLRIDIIMIYDLEQLEMIPDVYEGQKESDAFLFKNSDKKRDALLGVIRIF